MNTGIQEAIIHNLDLESKTYRGVANNIKDAVEEAFGVETSVLEGYNGLYIPIPKCDGTVEAAIGYPAIALTSVSDPDATVTSRMYVEVGILTIRESKWRLVYGRPAFQGMNKTPTGGGGGGNVYYYITSNWTLRVDLTYNSTNTPLYSFAIFYDGREDCFFTLSSNITELKRGNEKITCCFVTSNANGYGLSCEAESYQITYIPSQGGATTEIIALDRLRVKDLVSDFIYVTAMDMNTPLKEYSSLTYQENTPGHPVWRDGIIIDGEHYLVPTGYNGYMSAPIIKKP